MSAYTNTTIHTNSNIHGRHINNALLRIKIRTRHIIRARQRQSAPTVRWSFPSACPLCLASAVRVRRTWKLKLPRLRNTPDVPGQPHSSPLLRFGRPFTQFFNQQLTHELGLIPALLSGAVWEQTGSWTLPYSRCKWEWFWLWLWWQAFTSTATYGLLYTHLCRRSREPREGLALRWLAIGSLCFGHY